LVENFQAVFGEFGETVTGLGTMRGDDNLR